MVILNKDLVKLLNSKNDILVINSRLDLDSAVYDMGLDSLSDLEIKQLVTIINCINDQEIQDIDKDKMKYTIATGEKLPLRCLATSEKVFLVSYLARVKNVNIAIPFNMLSLEKSVAKKYAARFFPSSNVILVANDLIQESKLREVGISD